MLVRDGGVACIMAAYGSVNGERTSQSSKLLRDLLKGSAAQGGFGFRGFVISDWWGTGNGQNVPSPATAEDLATVLANAGLDVELPWIMNYGGLAGAVQANRVRPAVIADAAARVLEQKARFHSALGAEAIGLREPVSTLNESSIATNAAHLALAERAEVESAVLLQNGLPRSPVLPIGGGVRAVAVIGANLDFALISTTPPKSCGDTGPCSFHFATDVALGDRGTNAVNADPTASIDPFSGIQAAAANHGVTVTSGDSAASGANADLIAVVVGLTPGDEGEEYTIQAGGDRSTLTLPGSQAELVDDALSLMKPTVVIIESGSVVALPWLDHQNRNQATIWAGYGGMRAGAALGKLLFGDANFSGKLPIAWPAESALPSFKGDPNLVTTKLSYFFGYREYDRRTAQGEQADLVFPFGHGLSYTTFAYSDLAVPCAQVNGGAVLDVTANVRNTGSANGDEVAYLFVKGPDVPEEPRSVKELKSFARVSLAPGATERVHLPVRVQDLKHWSTAQGSWVIDPGDYTVLVGPSAAEGDLQLVGTFTVPG